MKREDNERNKRKLFDGQHTDVFVSCLWDERYEFVNSLKNIIFDNDCY